MDATGLPALDLHLSTFDHALDIVPKSRVVPLPELIRALTVFRHHPEVPHKRQLPAWSPATFHPGATRRRMCELFAQGLSVDSLIVGVEVSGWSDSN